MDKRIIVGLAGGAIFGLLEMFLFGYGFKGLLLMAVLGGLIGFASTKVENMLHYYIASAVVGVLFFMVLAMGTGSWIDELLTGGLTGLAIGFITDFVSKKNLI